MANQEKFDLIVRARDEASAVINSITGSVGKMVAGMAAVGAAGAFLKGSIQAAAESQKVFASLGRTIEKQGGNWRALETDVKAFATSLMLRTGESDEAIARSMQTFMDFGATVSQAANRVSLAIDIARQRQMDLASVTDALARAQNGMTRGLVQLGLSMDEAKTAAHDFDGVLKSLNQKYGGAAVADMKTYEGQLRLLKEQLGETKETVGGQVVPAMTDLMVVLNHLGSEDLRNKLFSLWAAFGVIADPKLVNKYAEAIRGLQRAYDLFGVSASKVQDFFSTIPPSTAISWIDDYEDAMKRAAKAVEERSRAEATMRDVMREAFAPQLESEARVREALARARQQLAAAGPQAEKPRSAFEMMYGDTRAADEAFLSRQSAVADMFISGAQDAARQLVNAFTGARVELANVFRGMATDFLSFFVQAILQKKATSLAGSFLSFLGMASAGGGSVATGTDLKGRSGYNLMPGAAMAPASVVVNIGGDVIGDEHHVRTKIIPAIERAAALNATRIALAR